MKTKSFWQTNAFLVLFCIAFWMLMFFAIPSEAAPKKYKGHAKVEREFSKRKYQNLAEQESQQYQGIKIYNPRNKWQKHMKRGRK